MTLSHLLFSRLVTLPVVLFIMAERTTIQASPTALTPALLALLPSSPDGPYANEVDDDAFDMPPLIP